MSDKHDFIVKNGVLIRYRGPGGTFGFRQA